MLVSGKSVFITGTATRVRPDERPKVKVSRNGP